MSTARNKVTAALVALQAAPVDPVLKLLIPFIVLTAARLREATEAKDGDGNYVATFAGASPGITGLGRHASWQSCIDHCPKWSEFDLDARLWTIPAKRMKKRKQHRVPVSDQLLRILAAARALNPPPGLVFGFRNGRRPRRALNSGEISKVLRDLGLTDAEGRDVVAHGFRSTFTDWAADNTDGTMEAAEAALAHAPETDTRKAYRRNDLLKPRRPLMQEWANYVFPPERS